MTATLQRPGTVPSFHRSAVFWPVVGATVAVTAAMLLTSPPSWSVTLLVIGTIGLLGIPHGSLDHVVTARLQGDRFSFARFTGRYVAAMGAVGLLWLASPSVALATFVLVSMHHFGQSDLAYLALDIRRQLPLQWTRGLLVIVLPLLAHLGDVAPVVERLGADAVADWADTTTIAWPWLAGIVAVNVAALAVAASRLSLLQVGREAVTVAALATLFLVADPLLAFAVYFGLWHSVNHLLVLVDTIGSRRSPLGGVVRQAAPLAAVSLAGLGAFTLTAVAAGRTDLVVPLAFVFVSMLTVPHLVVVERLWRWRLAAERELPSQPNPADP